MEHSQMKKLVWLVETIFQAKRINFNEINNKWKENVVMSGGDSLSKRTFHKWLRAISDTFGLEIFCDQGGEYCYYINNMDMLKNGSMEKWLLSMYNITNSLEMSRSLKDRIILEDVPSGLTYLEPIIDAMKNNRMVHITYYNYWRGDEREHFIMPLCVKLFRQRWYVVGRIWSSGVTCIFSLDRIRGFRLSSHTFVFPDDFVPESYFHGCFGVIVDMDTSVETVRLKVSAGQANYLRDLPLQPDNQREVESHSDYSIFELRIRPTFDFQQELLWNGDDIEVLEPQWLRKELAGKIKRMAKKYVK